MILFDQAWACAHTGTAVVEGYSPKEGLAHGSLDVTVSVCARHHQVLRAQLDGCGMTPYSLNMVSDRLCGTRTTFEENTYTSTYPGTE